MTQSKNKDTESISITYDYDKNYLYDTDTTTGTFTISLDDTFSTDNTITLDNTYSVQSYSFNQDFIDTMPSIHRVDSMCKEYPALAKVFEKFKTIYKMCEQDYKGKLKERGLDDDIPF